MSTLMELPQDQSIEQQYEQGPPQAHDMEVPHANITSAQEAHAFLDDQLPLMRKQSEYDELMIKQLTNDALLNRRPIEQIPGLLGLELKVRQEQAKGYLLQIVAYKDNIVKDRLEKEAHQKEQAIKTGITRTLEYTGDNVGQVQMFVQDKPLEDAPNIKLDEGNTEKRISFTVEDTGSQTGRREITMTPGIYIIRCGDKSIWTVTKYEYNKLSHPTTN